jgi:hypothetical protein
MSPVEHDPLAQAEHAMHEMHQLTYRQLKPIHRKYPLLFLFLATFSIAAIFHGLDGFLDQIKFLNKFPLVLVFCGVLGLFIAGALYKRLGKDKYE